MLRVLLLLLALLTASPATAAMPTCHDAPVAAAHAVADSRHHRPDTQHHRRDATPPHACLGCIPLSDWLAAPLPSPRLAPATAPMPRIATLDLGRGPPPPLRPPRLS